MNDRLPGSSWDNPIWYKKYRICVSDMYEVHGFAYDFCHDSYDGAPDAGDHRAGQARSIEEAKMLIDDLEDK